MPSVSVLKDQMGINASVVCHNSHDLHCDIDYFRADAEWWLGDRQVVNVVNSGLTLTW